MKTKQAKKIRNIWKSCLFLFTLIVGFLGASRGLAATLPQSMIIADEKGFTVKQDGKYFIDIPNVMPGETYTKEITLRSTDAKDPFDLGLRVHPKEKSGDVDFNEHVTMTLNLDGKDIYQGKILGDSKHDWTKELLSLGRFKFGTDKFLKVSFTVDKNLTSKDFEKENNFLFVWEFVATKDGKPIRKELPKTARPLFRLPQTGEEWRDLLYKILVGILLLLIVLLLWKKNRETEKKRPVENGDEDTNEKK